MNATMINNQGIEALLNELIGETVSVWTGENQDRRKFDPSISITGKLEKHPEEDRFRVVLSEGCYCYFKPPNVMTVAKHPERFKDGAKAVIRISIDSPIIPINDNDN